MLYFCGAPRQVRHRIIFCGALASSAPQKYIPPIRVFLLVYAFAFSKKISLLQYDMISPLVFFISFNFINYFAIFIALWL
jgi:hypothetical protein